MELQRRASALYLYIKSICVRRRNCSAQDSLDLSVSGSEAVLSDCNISTESKANQVSLCAPAQVSELNIIIIQRHVRM